MNENPIQKKRKKVRNEFNLNPEKSKLFTLKGIL